MRPGGSFRLKTLGKRPHAAPEVIGVGPVKTGRGTAAKQAAHPDRFYQIGMAEQLLMGAAGMAREGCIPFATTYAVFAARRADGFICLGIPEEKPDVTIVCALPGPTTGYGPSHQAIEDIAIFRGVPHIAIVDPRGIGLRPPRPAPACDRIGIAARKMLTARRDPNQATKGCSQGRKAARQVARSSCVEHATALRPHTVCAAARTRLRRRPRVYRCVRSSG